jgi:tetratricopeptide (TPR) repeat protein
LAGRSKRFSLFKSSNARQHRGPLRLMIACLLRTSGLVALALAFSACQTLPPPAVVSRLPAHHVDAEVYPPYREQMDFEMEVRDERLSIPGLRAPSRAAFLHLRGITLSHLGRMADSARDALEAVRLQPREREYRLAAAQALARVGLFAEAESQLAAAARDPELQVAADRELGRIRFLQKRFEEAKILSERVALLDDDAGWAALTAAQARMALGEDPAPAAGVYLRQSGLQNWPRPIVEFYAGELDAEQLRAAARHPDRIVERYRLAEVAYYLAEVALARGDREDAVQLFQETVAAGMPGLFEHSWSMHRLIELGHSGRIALAPDTSWAASFADEEEDERWGELNDGTTLDLAIGQLLRFDEYEEAAEMLREWLAEHPDDDQRRRGLGSILLEGGKFDQAVQLWSSMLTGGPEDLELLVALGHVHLVQGASLQETEQSAGPKARRSNSRSQPAHRPEDLYARALGYLERARQIDADSVQAIGLQGAGRELSGDLTGSLAAWEEVIERRPDHPDAYLAAAHTLLRLERPAEARVKFEQAIKVEPRHPQAWIGLVDWVQAHGTAEEADKMRRLAAFSMLLPGKAELAYSVERLAQLRLLTDGDRFLPPAWIVSVDQVAPLAERELHAELVRQIAVQDAESTTLLLAYCWARPNDGEHEDLAFAELERRGAADGLQMLAANANVPTTYAKAGAALARMGDPRTFDTLQARLEHDMHPTDQADVAALLAGLGDLRAMFRLAAAMAPEATLEVGDSMGVRLNPWTLGPQRARARAALALGSFDTEYAQEALTRATLNREIALWAHLSLYRITGEPEHLRIAAPALLYDEQPDYESQAAVAMLEAIGSPEALSVTARWRQVRGAAAE